jgi:hypothetical protein
MPQLLFASETHWIGGSVNLRAGLDTEARRKTLCLFRGYNPGRLVIQSIVRHYTDWATQALGYDALPRKYWYPSTSPHGIITQNTNLNIFTTMRTSKSHKVFVLFNIVLYRICSNSNNVFTLCNSHLSIFFSFLVWFMQEKWPYGVLVCVCVLTRVRVLCKSLFLNLYSAVDPRTSQPPWFCKPPSQYYLINSD